MASLTNRLFHPGLKSLNSQLPEFFNTNSFKRTRVLSRFQRNQQFSTHQNPTESSFGKYDIVRPGKVSPKKIVPDHIPKPDYYLTGLPKPYDSLPPKDKGISNDAEMEWCRDACKLARSVLEHTFNHVKVGVTTDYLDAVAHEFILAHGAYPSPLNYKGFPKSICTSVNNVAIHGIPDDRELLDGDIVNVDVTVYYKGYHGDCSRTILVGNVDDAGEKLVSAARTCLGEGILVCGPGIPFQNIGVAIEESASRNGYSVIPNITGHGIGKFFHGPPDIYHIDYPYPGLMQPGMTFTIEPVITQGGEEIKILQDGWTVITEDNARTAQFEHTLLITSTGVEVLTMDRR